MKLPFLDLLIPTLQSPLSTRIDWGGFIPGTGNMRYAQTMAFTTLMMFQLFNVLNARSDERSAFVHLFSNVWLWASIGLAIVLQLFVLSVPVLQQAFSTVALSPADWLREMSKLVTRAHGRGPGARKSS